MSNEMPRSDAPDICPCGQTPPSSNATSSQKPPRSNVLLGQTPPSVNDSVLTVLSSHLKQVKLQCS